MDEELTLYTLNPAQSTSGGQVNLNYNQLITYHEEKHQLAWCYMNPTNRPCFNPTLTRELHQLYKLLHENNNNKKQIIRYQVLASCIPGVYNLGGDLELLKQCILNKDKDSLKKYAYSCIETVFAKLTLHQKGITHISLVQGDALGGGFEAALSADILVAERSAKLGLPEVLFNLFPGMGAYSMLSRKIGPSNAEKMVLSGRLYSAQQLFEMGVVDILAEDNQGGLAVYDYINRENRSKNAIDSMRKVKACCNPITLEELGRIVDIWTESAMNLSARDIRMMDRLLNKQIQRSRVAAA